MKSGPSSRRTVPTCVTQALGCPAADAVNARNMIRFLGSLDCRFEEILYLYPEAAYFLQRVLSNYKVSDDDDLCSWSTMTNALATLNYNIKLLESIYRHSAASRFVIIFSRI